MEQNKSASTFVRRNLIFVGLSHAAMKDYELLRDPCRTQRSKPKSQMRGFQSDFEMSTKVITKSLFMFAIRASRYGHVNAASNFTNETI
jgi:hypothetical protein